MHLVNTRANGIEWMNGRGMWLYIQTYQWQGILKVTAHMVSGILSESNLQNLLVKNAIICNGGLSGRKDSREPNVRVSKNLYPEKKREQIPRV